MTRIGVEYFPGLRARERCAGLQCIILYSRAPFEDGSIAIAALKETFAIDVTVQPPNSPCSDQSGSHCHHLSSTGRQSSALHPVRDANFEEYDCASVSVRDGVVMGKQTV